MEGKKQKGRRGTRFVIRLFNRGRGGVWTLAQKAAKGFKRIMVGGYPNPPGGQKGGGRIRGVQEKKSRMDSTGAQRKTSISGPRGKMKITQKDRLETDAQVSARRGPAGSTTSTEVRGGEAENLNEDLFLRNGVQTSGGAGSPPISQRVGRGKGTMKPRNGYLSRRSDGRTFTVLEEKEQFTVRGAAGADEKAD